MAPLHVLPPNSLTPGGSLLAGAAVVLLFVAVAWLAARGRRRARVDLAALEALREDSRVRSVGPAVVSGRAFSEFEVPIVEMRYPAFPSTPTVGISPDIAACVVVARRFWLATEEGPIAVDPATGTFQVDGHDRAAFPTSVASASSVRIGVGDRVEVAGFLRHEHLTELMFEGFRGAERGWVIGGDSESKLVITDREIALPIQQRLQRWTTLLWLCLAFALVPIGTLWRYGWLLVDGEATRVELTRQLEPGVWSTEVQGRYQDADGQTRWVQSPTSREVLSACDPDCKGGERAWFVVSHRIPWIHQIGDAPRIRPVEDLGLPALALLLLAVSLWVHRMFDTTVPWIDGTA